MASITATAEQLGVLDGNGEITSELLQQFQTNFDSDPSRRLMQNAVTQTAVSDVALNRAVVNSTDHTFSHLLDDWAVTNQKKSGRCWMFAGLNLFRVGAMKQMNLKEFEFSQNYTMFWDKLERANYFLEAIIQTSDRPVDDRTVAWLLERPLDDGGQWNMFVNIVNKHGLVPKSVMPETQSSSDTWRMNEILATKMREGAKTLRDLVNAKTDGDQLRAAKQAIIQIVHRVLCIHLGTPPTRFDWQWNDKDKEFKRDGEMTPHEFAEKYISVPVDEYVCLVHDPREAHPFGRTYTVEHLGNVVGGEIVKYLNVEIDVMKEIAMRTIMDGEPVWMGCDVGKMMSRDLGIWDANLFQFEDVYDTTFSLDKAARLTHHETLMTHAMLFTGVDVVEKSDEARSRRWRVENSWGEKVGQKGFYVMNDSWFDQHMFEIAARKSYLPPSLVGAIDQEPIVLPAWDPMGSLAR